MITGCELYEFGLLLINSKKFTILSTYNIYLEFKFSIFIHVVK